MILGHLYYDQEKLSYEESKYFKTLLLKSLLTD